MSQTNGHLPSSVLLHASDGIGRKDERLTGGQADDALKQLLGAWEGNRPDAIRKRAAPRLIILLVRHIGVDSHGGTCQMLDEGLLPSGRREPMNDSDGAQVEERRADGGLLRRDDDASAEVTLETDRPEKTVSQTATLAAVGHELVRLVEGCEAADVALLLEEEGEADVEK